MAKKQERVPGMTETKPNREQRRHPEGGPDDHPLVHNEQTPDVPDVPDPQTKTSGHKKKTAQNWNQ